MNRRKPVFFRHSLIVARLVRAFFMEFRVENEAAVEKQGEEVQQEEVVGQQGEATSAEQAREDDAALEAGFNAVRGERPADQAQEQVTEQSADADGQEGKPTAEQSNPDDIPEWAKKEITRLNNELQKVYGKFGSVEKRLQQPSQNAQVKPLAITPEALKRLKANWGDDFVADLAGDLTEALGAQSISQQQDTGQPALKPEVLVERIEELEQLVELTSVMPDWRGLRTHKQFEFWLKTKPAEYQQALLASRSANEVADGLKDFKNYLESSAVRSRALEEKNKRLRLAVTPKTSAAPQRLVLPDDAGLEIGFKKVRGGK